MRLRPISEGPFFKHTCSSVRSPHVVTTPPVFPVLSARWDNRAAVSALLKSDLYRKLPSVDEVLRSAHLSPLVAANGQVAVTQAVRAVLLRVREEIAQGRLDADGADLAVAGIGEAVEREIRHALSYSLRRVINATGVILHTNLGRAPLTTAALDHISDIAGGYSNLEFDVTGGERGARDTHGERLFHELLSRGAGVNAASLRGAISTIVVNNNAAAVLLALNTLAEGGEVIVSRGELVEIGGSFRIPEVMAKSNTHLREVGTTNRTRISDYEHAISDQTRALLRVHRSNFQITGFTEQPRIEELASLAHQHKLPLLEDLGSGSLLDLAALGVSGEPSVLDSLHAGVDVVSYSGDKLLGGPQAGMLSGRGDLIGRMRSNPLFRALRVDKLTYAALEATLLAYVKGNHGDIPVLRMMRLSKQEIGERAESLKELVRSAVLSAEVIDGESVIGGGSAPSAALPTQLVALRREGLSADELAAKLRAADPPVIGRVEEGRVLLDLRTVFPEQDDVVGRICTSL